MNERDIFDERQEVKKASFSCPHCRERADYDVRWLKRTKKKNVNTRNEQDRAQFQKSRDYMVRVDDMLMCSNMRCRKRFEIPTDKAMPLLEMTLEETRGRTRHLVELVEHEAIELRLTKDQPWGSYNW